MEDKERLMRDYMEGSMEYAKEFDDFVENHWALSMLDAPHSLVAVIETKISRAVLHERRRIIDLMIDGEFVNPKLGNTGLMAVLFHVQGNADWLSDKEIHALHHKIIDAIDTEE